MSFLIQMKLLNNYPAFGVNPNIGVVLISCIGVVSGTVFGSCIGAFYGLLFDISFGKTLGVHALLFMLIGAISGLFKSKISIDNRFSLVIMVILNTLIFEAILCFVSCLLYSIQIDWLYLGKVILVEEFYNIFLTFVLYKPLIFWGDVLNKSQSSYYILH